jgi:hypothetical protein
VGCGLDSTDSGQGPVAGCCECGVEPSGYCATELVSYKFEVVHKKTSPTTKLCMSVCNIEDLCPEYALLIVSLH